MSKEVRKEASWAATVVWYIHNHNVCIVFFFNDTATTEIYTLSLHDALPILKSHIVGFINGFGVFFGEMIHVGVICELPDIY